MIRSATFTSKEIAQELLQKAAARADMSGAARVFSVNEWDFNEEVTLTMHLCESDDDVQECLRELEAKRAGLEAIDND